ncbi:MAG TPA: XRE family transcriptional regulator [Anaeromyxobacteraceae bacterium]|nr:XRE family transcriptional regulator [Anaeromyxobacteraceae bacterium]
MRKDFGERIRSMREARELSREEVCGLTGLSADRLAAFEEGREVPSIGVVIKLSRVLGSRLGGLLHGGGTVSDALTVCRAGEAGVGWDQGDTDQGYTYRCLTRPGTPGHGMEPFLLTFDPRVTDARPLAHDGQEFVYVLDGEIELFYDGERRTLRPGDSAYLDARRPHLFRGMGRAPSQMLAVVWSDADAEASADVRSQPGEAAEPPLLPFDPVASSAEFPTHSSLPAGDPDDRAR